MILICPLCKKQFSYKKCFIDHTQTECRYQYDVNSLKNELCILKNAFKEVEESEQKWVRKYQRLQSRYINTLSYIESVNDNFCA